MKNKGMQFIYYLKFLDMWKCVIIIFSAIKKFMQLVKETFERESFFR